MSDTLFTLGGYILWTLVLVAGLLTYRTVLVVQKQKAPNKFANNGEDLSPFGQRLTRAYANSVEGFALFGGVLIFALLSGHSALVDPLAPLLLAARIVQSCVHLWSGSAIAVQVRFVFFVAQLVLAGYWLLCIFSQLFG